MIVFDQNDPLKHFRDKFYIPLVNGKECIYFTWNSLGLQPNNAGLCVEWTGDWASYGVEGHFYAAIPGSAIMKCFPNFWLYCWRIARRDCCHESTYGKSPLADDQFTAWIKSVIQLSVEEASLWSIRLAARRLPLMVLTLMMPSLKWNPNQALM